jgi:hypothetical protein
VPVYDFNVHDGLGIPDSDGTELADLRSARIEAVRLAGRLLMDQPEAFRERFGLAPRGRERSRGNSLSAGLHGDRGCASARLKFTVQRSGRCRPECRGCDLVGLRSDSDPQKSWSTSRSRVPP